MALVALLRGVNVGGHKTFRPTILARQLRKYDVINIGAAGTFIVRRPGPLAKFRAELLRRLPSGTIVVFCDGREFTRLVTENPFRPGEPPSGCVRFVSIFVKPTAKLPSLPIALPSERAWLVRLTASRGRFVFGEYRRHMKTIGYLGQIDKLYGVPATTRNWNTIVAIQRILKGQKKAR